MSGEPQGWTGELPPILRFLPRQPCCFLHFLEFLSKLWTGDRNSQSTNPWPRPLGLQPVTIPVTYKGNYAAPHLMNWESGGRLGK